MKNIVVLVFLCFGAIEALCQATIDSPADLKAWLASDVLGYKAEENAYAAELTQNNASYYMVAKRYAKNTSAVSIVVFDYRKQTDKITAATTSWKQDLRVEDDKQLFANSMVAGSTAFEQVDKATKNAQLLIYVAGRYLITLSSATESIESLKALAENLNISNLPRS
jgi:hypothetical protein